MVLELKPSAQNYCECSECCSKQVMSVTMLMLLLVWYLVRYVLNSLRRQQNFVRKKQLASWKDLEDKDYSIVERQ